MRTPARILSVLLLIALPAAAAAADKGLTVKGVRYFSYSGFTRIVFETEAAAPYVLTRSGDGKSLYFSSYGGPFVLKAVQLPQINDGAVKGMEQRQEGDTRSITITLGPAAGDVKDFVLRGPDRIVVDVLRGTAVVPEATPKAPVVVLDAGHGGMDTGMVSAQGVEKTLTLDLANTVRRLLKKSATKMTVLLTRERDQHMTLDERAAFANTSGARLFVSLHAAHGSGSRVFILDPDEGQQIVSAAGPTDFQGFDAVSEQQQMRWGTQQAGHSQESGRLGRGMARLLSGSEASEPDQAPLAQLKTVDSAAVLVESGAVSDRPEVAAAIAKGIELYVREKR